MKCVYHPDTDAAGSCVSCGAGVCDACRVMLAGKMYCQPCADMVFAQQEAAKSAPRPAPSQGPSLVQPSLLPRAQAPGAVTALVLGIVGFIIWPLGLILGPLAINYANQARDAVAMNPMLDGSGMATAGYVLGIVDTIFGVLFVLYIILMFTCAFIAVPF
jgi:hypothetical protein